MIVVLDASTFVSAVLKADSIPERALLRAMTFPYRIAMSDEIVAEYQEVIFRPKFNRIIQDERRRAVLDAIVLNTVRITPTNFVRECSDPKDDKYLAFAAAANADFIVSSDVRHLLAIHPWRGIPILSPAQFISLP